MQTKFSINLNKIALLRNSRGANYPSLESFAQMALELGVHGITLHPRPDQRHAKYSDISSMAKVLKDGRYHQAPELNIEGYPTETLLDEVLQSSVQQVTLVPDKPNQLTSNFGWNTVQDASLLRGPIDRLKEAGIRVSLFVDPDVQYIEGAAALGADRIEIYTESYAKTYALNQHHETLDNIATCVDRARALGLGVNAGHALNLQNLPELMARVDIDEVSIGHAVIVESLHLGFEKTVSQYLGLLT